MTTSPSATQQSLAEWLAYLESIHPTTIEMGLERSRQVFEKLSLSFEQSRIVMVAGTNGKGTTCRVIEALALAQGLKVGVYSSPHLVDYRERVRVNDQLLSEQQHIEAFQRVEACRDEISLTYFEFGTLAALTLMAELKLDLIILEVGLGGRLDAVNIVEPEISVITTIDLDHQDWLGDNRDKIALEKAGILRPSKPAVIGELDPPPSLRQEVKRLACNVQWQGIDFGFQEIESQTSVWQSGAQAVDIPECQFPQQNVATAIATARVLGWNIEQSLISEALSGISLPGRCQMISQKPDVLVDVAHNPQATSYLITKIKQLQFNNLHLVCAMLADKDSKASLGPFTELNAKWYLAKVNSPRSATVEVLKSCLSNGQEVCDFESISEAFFCAKGKAAPNDLIVVFGSFFTVAEVFAFLGEQ